MKWNKYTIETNTIATDILCGMLCDIGIDGVEVKDNIPLSEEDKKKMFVDILPIIPMDEGMAYVTFYLEENDQEEKTLKDVNDCIEEIKSFMDPGKCTIEKDVTEDKDWINKWKEFFKTFTVDDIVIKPTWEKLEEKYKDSMVIEIDPGIAFGTGMHETTQLCMRQLRKYLKDDMTVLDAGCGSGILSIASMKLGAKEVTAVDIDELATTATNENFLTNGIDNNFKIIYGNVLDDKNIADSIGYEKYDIVVANILADVIIPLSKIISPHLKKGGIFITSGIINTKEEEVLKVIQENSNFEVIDVTSHNDWRSITAVKK